MMAKAVAITVRCTGIDKAYCPKCGSRNVLSIGTADCHCGQCGTSLKVEIAERITKENAPQYAQMSLF